MGQPKRVLFRTLIALAVLAAAVGLTSSGALAGSSASSSTVVRSVAGSAQSSTAEFWTNARLDSATLAGDDAATAQPVTAEAPPGTPDPVHFNGVRTVGALFYTTGSKAHFCTASVVDSATLNLILTAAHCVYGSSYATNIVYVPEWHNGISPYGRWPVTRITVAQGWVKSHNPSLDFAFLSVASPASPGRPIQRVTGGLRLGIKEGYAHSVYVIGLNDTDNQPLGCRTKSFEFEPGQMELSCNSYWDGTSGGPWILDFNPATGSGVVFGDIGGYEQGGDYAWTSYSDYYGAATLGLFKQAQLQQG